MCSVILSLNMCMYLQEKILLYLQSCTCVSFFLEGHHIPISEVIDHMTTVLSPSHSRLGVWLGTDYSHILLQHIISVPHYVLHMSLHKWEREYLNTCAWYCESQHTCTYLAIVCLYMFLWQPSDKGCMFVQHLAVEF